MLRVIQSHLECKNIVFEDKGFLVVHSPLLYSRHHVQRLAARTETLWWQSGGWKKQQDVCG